MCSACSRFKWCKQPCGAFCQGSEIVSSWCTYRTQPTRNPKTLFYSGSPRRLTEHYKQSSSLDKLLNSAVTVPVSLSTTSLDLWQQKCSFPSDPFIVTASRGQLHHKFPCQNQSIIRCTWPHSLSPVYKDMPRVRVKTLCLKGTGCQHTPEQSWWSCCCLASTTLTDSLKGALINSAITLF